MKGLSVTMVMMLISSSAVWAAEPEFIGNLHTAGIVLTNSVPLPDGATVRSGDRISTQPGAVALIFLSSRGRLELRSNSEARLGNGSVQLERGVVASSHLAVEAGGYTVRPQTPGSGWFAVARREGRVAVAAHRGAVLIVSAGAPPVVVPEGSLAQQRSEQSPAQEQQIEQKDQQKEKPARQTAAKNAGWTLGNMSHGASVALVVGLGLGVAAASAGAAMSLQSASSGPSNSR
ncbi:MAG: hypothetical protein HY236_02120 [Acidobacteria bacterium]|nr:hypothetical protein [Acidobacteriota bacterium]